MQLSVAGSREFCGVHGHMINTLIHVIYPPQCRACDAIIAPSDIFCLFCTGQIKPIVTLYLPVSKTISMPVFAISAYVQPLRQMVLKKFYGDRLASRQLGRLALTMTPLKMESFDVVVPVPLHWTRYAWRGFNQACEMGAAVAHARGVPLVRFLARTRRTTFQSRLTAEERRKNVSQVFGISPWYRWWGADAIRDKHVLLVDDLCTTGATLSQAAKIIAKHKPASITALVACRAV